MFGAKARQPALNGNAFHAIWKVNIMSDTEQLYAITIGLDGAVTGIAEVNSGDNSLDPETISPNESYLQVDGYVVLQESDSGGSEWAIYALDNATGYWSVVAEGDGVLDVTDIAGAITAYVPGEDDREDTDDDNEGTEEDDEFSGDEGDDGDDSYVGNGGNDHLTYLGATNTHVDLRIRTAQDTGHGFDLIDGIRNLSTGSGDDDLIGNGLGNDLDGNDGNDSLDGGGGNDSLDGGANNDQINGGLDNDLLGGGAGNDNVLGAAGRDTITGGLGYDSLDGGAGNDSLDGGANNDRINGGLDNDRLGGGAGNDLVVGAAGNDTIGGSDGDDTVGGGAGNDTVDGGIGNDNVTGSYGNDDVIGGAGNDTIAGGDGIDALAGGLGQDLLDGGSGQDLLLGGAGLDVLRGGIGSDTLQGGAGRDNQTGGAGADYFVFTTAADAARASGPDVITDFTSGVDVIDFAALNLTYIGRSAFSHTAGELRFVDQTGGGSLRADLNGDGAYDLAVVLTGVHSIDAATDLVL